MDDLNALAEAVACALNEGEEAKSLELCTSMDRFVLALGWNAQGALPAILTYAGSHRDDDLFAPAFVLRSIAPERPETAELLARSSPDAQTLLDRLRTLRP